MVKEKDIIKVNGMLLFVTNVSNQGTYKCKDKKGRLIWSSYLQNPVVMERKTNTK